MTVFIRERCPHCGGNLERQMDPRLKTTDLVCLLCGRAIRLSIPPPEPGPAPTTRPYATNSSFLVAEWTPEEDAELVALYAASQPRRLIAKALGRSSNAVHNRMLRLRDREKPG